METLTQNQALAAGGILGGMLATVGVATLIVYILMIIAWWKIFTKAGEAGWKSLIPIYNTYVFCNIIGINFWIYVLAVPFVIGIIGAIVGTQSNLVVILQAAYVLFIDILFAIKLGDAFKKGAGFKVGLFFLPFIFYLILAFGNPKYAGAKATVKK